MCRISSGLHWKVCLPAPWIHSSIASTLKGTNLVLLTIFFFVVVIVVSIGMTWEEEFLVCSACSWVYKKEQNLRMSVWKVLFCPCQDCVNPSLQSVSD